MWFKKKKLKQINIIKMSSLLLEQEFINPASIEDVSIQKTILELMDKMRVEDDVLIRLIPLHKEYLKMLREKGISHSQKSITEYKKIVTDEIIKRENRELGWNEECLCIGLHMFVIIEKEKNEFSWHMDQKMCGMLENFLKTRISNEIHVPGYILRLEKAFENRKILEDMSFAYFEQGTKIRRGTFLIQERKKHERTMHLFVPVFIKYSYPESPATALQFYQSMHDIIFLKDTDDLEKSPLDKTMEEKWKRYKREYEIYTEEMMEEIKKSFNGDFDDIIISPFATNIYNLKKMIDTYEKHKRG